MLPQSGDEPIKAQSSGRGWMRKGPDQEDPENEGAVTTKKHRGLFADIMNLKAKNRAEVLGEAAVYNVMDFYKTRGIVQQIARTSWFENVTLAIIAMNAIYIGIDTQYNKAKTLSDANAEFQVCEQLFTIYFFWEIMTRFFAFERKIFAFKDHWFQFDAVLVTLMVMENWILVMFSTGGGGLGSLSILRLLRLLRLTRMVRLMRAIPEFLTLIKGMAAATRSVASTLALLVLFNYVYAIIFTEMLKDSREWEDSEGNKPFGENFGSMSMSMYTLFLAGTLLDDISAVMAPFLTEQKTLLWVFLSFVLISAFTILNMLIGILCEVISKTAETEQEKMLIKEAKDRLTSVFVKIDRDGSGRVSKREFDLMADEPEVLKAFESLGVEPKDVLILSDSIFDADTADGKVELTFGQFLDVVTHMRPENTASVLDIADIRRAIRKTTKSLEAQVKEIAEAVATLQQAQGIPVTVTIQRPSTESPMPPLPAEVNPIEPSAM